MSGYRVIKGFTDLQDKGRPYKVGDPYPRRGLFVSAERIAELCGSGNRQKTPLIEKIEEEVTSQVTGKAETDAEAPKAKPRKAKK